MKYYPIDESAARRAKQANSLSDYAEGSAIMLRDQRPANTAERLIERLHWRRSARKARPRPSRRRLITCLTAMPAAWLTT